MKHQIRITALIAGISLAGLGVTACGDTRWCEEDQTDIKVADSYCENGTPGYEWEPDSDDHKHKPTKPTSKKPNTKTTPPKKTR